MCLYEERSWLGKENKRQGDIVPSYFWCDRIKKIRLLSLSNLVCLFKEEYYNKGKRAISSKDGNHSSTDDTN